MFEEDFVRQTVQLLSVAIGMIMEDHAGEGVTALPEDPEARLVRMQRLGAAGRDIDLLARSGEILLRRMELGER